MTPADRFHLRRTSKQPPALGHTFDAQNVCACGQKWPADDLCPLTVARLDELVGYDERLRREKAALNERVRNLEYALGQLLRIAPEGDVRRKAKKVLWRRVQ